MAQMTQASRTPVATKSLRRVTCQRTNSVKVGIVTAQVGQAVLQHDRDDQRGIAEQFRRLTDLDGFEHVR